MRHCAANAVRIMASCKQTRNVVILGKTGAGKSTVANFLVGDSEGKLFKVNTSFKSGTYECESKCKTHVLNGLQYKVKVIDTVGLFDTKTGRAGNDDVIQSIETYISGEIPEGVHLILFVCKHGRWTEEEQDTFEKIVTNFRKGISNISALVMTACETFSEARRKQLLDEFMSGEKTSEVGKFMRRGLYTVGFPNKIDLLPQLWEVYEPQTRVDANKLLDLVAGCESQMQIDQTLWTKIKDCIFL